jgi:hypothetical protein
MKCKVQHLRQRATTTIMQKFDEFDTDVLTLGRATDQNIFLADPLVALKHACIRASGADEILIEALTPAGVQVNGKVEQKTRLKSGDRIVIGGFKIMVFPPDGDHRLILAVESPEKTTSASAPQAEKKTSRQSRVKTKTSAEEIKMFRLPMQLAQAGLRKRRWAWISMIVILGLCLIAPALVVYGPLAKTRFAVHFPADKFWETGPLSHVHQHFGNNCRICHTKPFVMVENQTCINCHLDVTKHADPQTFDMAILDEARCGFCHKEHNNVLALKPAYQSLCTDCHLDMTGAGVLTALGNVGDFALDHPQFKPTVRTKTPGQDESLPIEWQRISINDSKLLHESGLKFPHDKHLVAKGVTSPGGTKVLECIDCHRSEPGGAYFLPVQMEAHCQECHALTFDPATPDRVVPHADLQRLQVFLDEFYALQALQGGYRGEDAPPVVQMRRRPNTQITAREQQDVLRWAESQAQKMAREIVEIRSCVTCHDITLAPNTVAGWNIDPVYASSRWFAMARFDHRKHRQSDCKTCHAATNSSLSTDVLMPGIDTCRECHGSEKAHDKYPSSCILCHQFHIDDKPGYAGQAYEAESIKTVIEKAKHQLGL